MNSVLQRTLKIYSSLKELCERAGGSAAIIFSELKELTKLISSFVKGNIFSNKLLVKFKRYNSGVIFLFSTQFRFQRRRVYEGGAYI